MEATDCTVMVGVMDLRLLYLPLRLLLECNFLEDIYSQIGLKMEC